MEERIEFVVKAGLEGSNLRRLCREYGVSRTTGYLWRRRYEEAGSWRGLAERSRRPQHSPARTAAVVEQRVEELRRRYGWGGKKLAVLLAAEGTELSVATVNRILRRRGLVEPPAGYGRATTRLERAAPNERWQMDFKGQGEIREGWCYPLTMLDDHRRYLVGLQALLGPEGSAVEACLVRSVAAYGVPGAMLMDHGVPWWSTTKGHGLTRVSVGLIRQGIRLYYRGVRHPQTQGKVERLHGTLKRRLGRQGYPADLAACTRVLEDFRQEYNQVRPHEALGMQVRPDTMSRVGALTSPRPARGNMLREQRCGDSIPRAASTTNNGVTSSVRPWPENECPWKIWETKCWCAINTCISGKSTLCPGGPPRCSSPPPTVKDVLIHGVNYVLTQNTVKVLPRCNGRNGRFPYPARVRHG